MKTKNKKSGQNQTRAGSVLSLVLIMVIALSLIGLALLRIGMNARMRALNTTHEMCARAAADSGLIQGLKLMDTKLTTSIIWDDSIMPVISPTVELPNCQSSYSYIVKGDSTSGFEITSTGNAGTYDKIVYSTLKLKGLFDYAIFASDSIELKMGTTVDAYNLDADDPPLQIVTNSTDAGVLNMRTGVTIDGDVVVGPSGDPDTIINSRLEAVITGDSYPLEEEHELIPVIVPPDLLLMPSKGILAGNQVIIASGCYDSINIKNSETVLVSGNVRLYIKGDVTIDSLAQITLDETNPTSELTLFMGGDFQEKNGGLINNSTMDPHKLAIFGLPTCQNIDFLTECDFYGTIYAPSAEVMLHIDVEIFGAIVSETFIQNVDADFHYDASLRDPEINDYGVTFGIDRWREF